MFLDNAASTQRPRQVIDAISGVYERTYANVHRGIHTLSELSTEQYETARAKVQAFINAAIGLLVFQIIELAPGFAARRRANKSRLRSGGRW